MVANKFKWTGLACLCLCAFELQAQPVVFSSDQWPKRWERAMNGKSLGALLSVSPNRSSQMRKAGNQGWGQVKDRGQHKRSRTPDYQHKSFYVDEDNQASRRYSIPPSNYQNYGAYQNVVPNIYGNAYGNQQLLTPLPYGAIYPGVVTPGLLAPGYGAWPAYPATGLWSSPWGFGSPFGAPGLIPAPGMIW